jgi:hypothetical protein
MQCAWCKDSPLSYMYQGRECVAMSGIAHTTHEMLCDEFVMRM